MDTPAQFRILLVEDSPVAAAMMTAILSREGFDVAASVGDGATALDAAARTRFDLAIVDLQLPDMSGSELMAQLRTTCPATRLIACSADAADSAEVVRAREHADGIVSKQDLARSGAILRNVCRTLPAHAA